MVTVRLNQHVEFNTVWCSAKHDGKALAELRSGRLELTHVQANTDIFFFNHEIERTIIFLQLST